MSHSEETPHEESTPELSLVDRSATARIDTKRCKIMAHGELAVRLLAALEAAEQEGGEIRR